jgi:dTMP kinase
MAYQGYGLGADREAIAVLARLIGLVPGLTLVLDVSEAAARTRLAGRGGGPDRYEALGADFHARVRAGFRAIAEAEPDRCKLVAAEGTEAEVHGRIMGMVRERFGLNGGA